MRRVIFLALPVLFLLLVGCGDQPTSLEPDLTASFKKPVKPPKPPPPDEDPLVFVSIETSVHPLRGAFTCAIEDADGNGVGPAYCWGTNFHLSLGLGGKKKGGKTTPTKPAGGSGLEFSQVHLGNQYACGIEDEDADGAGPIYCWGWNGNGRLGDGTTVDRSTPRNITPDMEFFALDVGSYGSCAISSTQPGKAYCWGAAYEPSVPTLVNSGEIAFQSVAMNGSGACGIDGLGNAYCWPLTGTPVQVATEFTFQELAIAYSAICGLTTAGDIVCWDPEDPASVPTSVGVESHRPYSALSQAFCALGAEGQGYCWGRNEYGQVGDGTVSPFAGTLVEVPTEVGYPFNFSQIGDKNAHTCGIAMDGDAYCWGSNDSGELGNGTTQDSPIPVKVSGQ